jgi:phosphoadenosine phosphosulfate reductase
MIRYVCNHCDGLSCETSVCPNCGQKAEATDVSVFWCDQCNVPCFDKTCGICGGKTRYIGPDIRPVFPQERLLLETLMGEPMKYAGHSVWCAVGNTFIIDGKVHHLSYGSLQCQNPEEVRQKMAEYDKENEPYVQGYESSDTVQNFVAANKNRLAIISDEARHYILERSKGFNISSMFVSFSGGKDSTITSDLVMKALGTESIVHIYGDTTLEYPETGEYMKRFRTAHPATPILVARNNDQDFNDLCTKVGPPSRVLRWCCTVFKTGAITKTIESTYGDVSSILAFFGLRRFESKARAKYDRDTNESKIKKQAVASPIIDWTTFDDWLYIFANHLDFNGAYRQGFARVGCWCCPNNSGWSSFLSSIYMPKEFNRFQSMLFDFAKSTGKTDWEGYVKEGMWKARQGGNGLEMSKNAVVTFKPCAFDKKAINFELLRPIDERLYTLFKPFGIIDKTLGNKNLGEVYILDAKTKQPLMVLSGRLGSTNLRVAIVATSGKLTNQKQAELLVTDQITKFQTCIGCGACQSVCKYGALTVRNTQAGEASVDSVNYEINSDLCMHCLGCVNHFDCGCYMKKVLRVKNGTKF